MRPLAAWLSLPLLATSLIATAPAAWAECSTDGLPGGRKVAELQTTVGELCIELLDDADEAPRHVENFLHYIVAGEYDGVLFHRFVPDFVMQGGQWKVGPDATTLVNVRPDIVVPNEPCTPDLPAPPSEPTTCSVRGNEAYTIALAKRDGEPDSGTSQWFINLVDNRANLDRANGGFTVFGRLIHPQSFATADRMAQSLIADAGDLFWSRSRFGYDTIEFEGQEYLLPEQAEMPLQDDPYPTGAYGCLDMTQQATIVVDDALPDVTLDPNDPEAPEPAAHIASAPCGTPVESSAAWVQGPGTLDCPEPDRLAVRSLSPEPLTALDGDILPAFDVLNPLEYVSFTCEQLQESDAQRALWRADFRDLLVEVESATVRVAVPEPGALASAAAALGCLGGLVRLDRRKRRTAQGPRPPIA